MTAVDVDKAVIFDGLRTPGTWGPVLAACAQHDPGAELRVRIRAHLKRYPMLTAYEVARALGLSDRVRRGSTRVRNELVRMEAAGEAERHEVPRSEGDHRPAVKWTAA